MLVARIADILSDYQPGDEHGWEVEFAHLAVHHRKKLRKLQASIERHGIREPLLLGNDGRLWDGHHRLLIAVGLDHGFVIVKKAGE